MKMYTLFLFSALAFLQTSAGAQTSPTPGLGCTAGAHVFCVTSTGDDSSDPAPNAGTGTLRQAIIDSNAAGGANTIGFDIPNIDPAHPVPQTITIPRQLPAINGAGTETSLIVDGYSQPGSVLNTNAPDEGGLNTKLMIEIVGGGGFYGFFYSCCPFPKIALTYQGFAMHGFAYMIAGQAYGLTAKAQINIYGSFLGTSVDGSALPAGSNGTNAILAEYDDAQIGGAQPWQRNVISGIANGPAVTGGTPSDTIIVEGNLIGTDATGTQAIPNAYGIQLGGNQPGLRVGCSGAGCSSAASRNVISGNRAYGVTVWDSFSQNSSGLQIKGNYIGTDWTGTKPLPNGNTLNGGGCPFYCGGIDLQGNATTPSVSIIGGYSAGESNLIAWNLGFGIGSYNNELGASFTNQANAIHNNQGGDVVFNQTVGPIANDAGDADTGTNNQQNFPEIQSASVSGTPGDLTLNVTYLVNSATSHSTYPLRIDFYVDVDEGSGDFLVSDSYPAASASMPRTVSLPLPASVQELTGFVVGATDANGYSSELSPGVVFDRIFADGFATPR